MAILLDEEGLLERSRIYATDLSDAVVRRAQAGVFPLAAMKEYTESYQSAGGRRTFSHYYTATADGALLHPWLRRHVLFAQHNLAADAAFNEFNVVLCRNVMIYFGTELQARVHRLVWDSLALSGVLALGLRETIRLSPHEHGYRELDGTARLYQKTG